VKIGGDAIMSVVYMGGIFVLVALTAGLARGCAHLRDKK